MEVGNEVSMTHIHEWECMNGTRICCTRCNTVSDIETAIENAEERAAKQAKIELLGAQLFAGELKKDAYDKYYAWMMQNSPDTVDKRKTQKLPL